MEQPEVFWHEVPMPCPTCGKRMSIKSFHVNSRGQVMHKCECKECGAQTE